MWRETKGQSSEEMTFIEPEEMISEGRKCCKEFTWDVMGTPMRAIPGGDL
jgi:hypothetical protein